MLNVSSDDGAPLCLVRSDYLLRMLLQKRCGLEEGPHQKSLGEYVLLAIDALYPEKYRKNTVNSQISRSIVRDGEDFYSLDACVAIFDKYYLFNGSNISLRIGRDVVRGEGAMALAARVHPAIIIGLKLATLFCDGVINLSDLRQYGRMTLPLALPMSGDHIDIIDNHFHWNGGGEPGALVLDQGRAPQNEGWPLRGQPLLSDFPLLASGSMSFEQVYQILMLSLFEIERSIFLPNLNDSEVGGYSLDFLYKMVFDIRPVGGILSGSARGDLEIQNIARYEELSDVAVMFRMALECREQGFLWDYVLFYFTAMSIIIMKRDKRLFYPALMSLHCFNILRSSITMSRNVGLEHFIDFFGRKANLGGRAARDLKSRDIAHSLVRSGVKRVVIKVGARSEPEQYRKMFIDILKSIGEFSEYRNDQGHLDSSKIRFSVHFIRQGRSIEDVDLHYHEFRRNILQEARALEIFLHNPTYYNVCMEDVIDNYPGGSGVVINVSKMVVSIDAAGNEIITPPEVFSPIFRYLRRPVVETFIAQSVGDFGENWGRRHEKLRISVHSGEDFPSLISGIRRIDEVLNFYDMGRGDSIGHALSMGISPETYISKQYFGEFTWGDLLDDLAWVSCRLVECHEFWSEATGWAKKIDHIAIRVWQEFSSSCAEMTREPSVPFDVRSWFEFWNLRRYCPIACLDHGFSEFRQYRSVNYLELCDGVPAHEWYKLFHGNSQFGKKLTERVLLKDDSFFSTRNLQSDILSIFNNCRILEFIQDYVIDQCRQRDVVIEVCPTSNIFVGFIDGYRQHPIYRWRPIESNDLMPNQKYNKFGLRKGPLQVCINSDDPAIFSTSLVNEYQMIRAGAQSDNYNAIDVWVDSLIRTSRDLYTGTKL